MLWSVFQVFWWLCDDFMFRYVKSEISVFDIWSYLAAKAFAFIWHAQLNRYYIKISIPSTSFFISLLPFSISLFLSFSCFPTVFLFLESRNYNLPQCVVRYSGNHEWIRREFLAFKIQKKRTMKKDMKQPLSVIVTTLFSHYNDDFLSPSTSLTRISIFSSFVSPSTLFLYLSQLLHYEINLRARLSRTPVAIRYCSHLHRKTYCKVSLLPIIKWTMLINDEN